MVSEWPAGTSSNCGSRITCGELSLVVFGFWSLSCGLPVYRRSVTRENGKTIVGVICGNPAISRRGMNEMHGRQNGERKESTIASVIG